MATRLFPRKVTNINIEQVNVDVTCPACKRTYNVQMKKPQFSHNCRCNRSTFYFEVSPLLGKVVVKVEVATDELGQQVYPLLSEEIYIEDF